MRKYLILIAIGSWIFLLGGGETAMGKDNHTTRTLPPCGTKPNCVSSQSTSARHSIEPFVLDGSGPAAIRKLRAIIADLPRTTIIQTDDRYLHAAFKSRLFGFVDDVEFLADAEAGRVEVRSASRLGYYDFGVNRRRVEKIRRLYESATVP